MKLTPARTLTLLTLVLCAALASQWLDPQGHWRNISWAVPAVIAPDLKAPERLLPGSSPATATYASIPERPLFAPDRRPPPPPAPPAPPDPFASIQIQGIFSGANAGILARVDGKVRQVKLNENVGAWTLKSIDDRTLTFANGTETRQLKLQYAALGPRAPVAASAQGATPGATPQPAVATTPAVNKPNSEDAARENIRRRNELRAARGLPLITQ